MARDLATVDRERRDLIATVSHELRTPLTALGLRLENLADGVEEADPEALADLLTHTRRLGSLVTDLLDLSRVQAGSRPLALAEVDVAALMESVVADVTLPTRPVTYAAQVAPSGLSVTADPARLRQLVTNVLDNAGRHSPPGGTVTVSATLLPGDRWALEVSDQGPGIPAEDRQRVFERFGTLSGHEGGGTGLGLAIARWVAELHGGTIRFEDPPSGLPGARLRVELPLQPPTRPVVQEDPVSTVIPPPPPGPPAPVTAVPSAPFPVPVAAGGGMDLLFGRFWVERHLPGRPDLLLLSLATGVLAGIVIPNHSLGLAALLVLGAAGGTVLYGARHRLDPFTLTGAVLCGVLASTVVLRDAEWIVALSLLAGGALLTASVTRASTVTGFLLAALSWPLAGLRGLPWLGRTATVVAGAGRKAALLRTIVLSGAGVLVFGLLFASADALFAHWLDLVVPDWTIDSFVLRAFTAVFVAGVVLAAAYLALNPPSVDVEGVTGRRPVQRRYEWLTPVLLVNAVFALFLVAQLTELSGGDGYVQRTTGLTYSEFAHRGFWQLIVATLLMLLVVWAANRKASVETEVDRRWLRGSLGLLCLLTLVVVWSALHRMDVYDQAYGFTRLRLLVSVFEGWLGVVVLGVLVAGIRLRGRWLARFALLTGAAALAGLGLVNPDAWIARHNIDRFEATGKIDTWYLHGLSADAVPVVMTLPADQRVCAVPVLWTSRGDGWLSWNLGRARAADAVAGDASWDDSRSCDGGGSD
jgi:hypothetical protein